MGCAAAYEGAMADGIMTWGSRSCRFESQVKQQPLSYLSVAACCFAHFLELQIRPKKEIKEEAKKKKKKEKVQGFNGKTFWRNSAEILPT